MYSMIKVSILTLIIIFVRECIERKDVQAKYVKSHDQAVDIFTRPLK